MLTDKERYEYAEEMVELANKSGGIPSEEDLMGLIARRGEVETPEDQEAILKLVQEMILHNQEQEHHANEEASEVEDDRAHHEEIATADEVSTPFTAS